MPRADRASQFAPFAALKGYEEALRAMEYEKVPKSQLSEEMLEYLDYKLNQINVGEMVTLVYYEDGAYVKKTGLVSKIDKASRYIRIVKTDINFDDIKDIRL
ncbi:MAG: YolD-like family protein [Pseudobutyrivibrio sp.]|nr:YolD-like family protein [Pseudobutyrivibrio sp.]